jgi:serine/threonine-protein kinase
VLHTEMGRPATIGRYDIRREIGRGMMGVVYEALDTVLQRTIALKAIQLAFPVAPYERESFERRFFTEAQIAARLSHPNIVVVHDVGRDPETGTLFIALEYLKGRALSEIVSPSSPMRWREALRIVRRVAQALHHAHAGGVVHRDVKPANVMLLESGEPKILDFGIAKLAQEQGHLTPGRHFFGTPLYMSPEQALGRPVDGRSDLFSLGAVLYFLLVGRPAFAAENIPTILVRVVRQYPPPPSFLVPEVPAAVDDIVARATAKDPAHRYPNGQAMAEDIEDVLAGRPARHCAGWKAPVPPPTGTGAGHSEADDPLAYLEAELNLATIAGSAARALMPTVEIPRAVGVSGAAVRAGAALAGADVARAVPEASPAGRADGGVVAGRTRRSAPFIAGAIAVVAMTATAFSPRPAGDASRAVGGESKVPASDAAAATLAGVASALSSSPVSRPAPARLALEVENSLKKVRLRLWVDGQLRLERTLNGGVARKASVSVARRGGGTELDVEPGAHEVKVQVEWDDNVRTERLEATFRAGQTRRLSARIGGFFRKTLRLRWR